MIIIVTIIVNHRKNIKCSLEKTNFIHQTDRNEEYYQMAITFDGLRIVCLSLMTMIKNIIFLIIYFLIYLTA